MLGRLSSSLLGVFDAVPFIGTDDSTLVGVFEAEPESFIGTLGGAFFGIFESEAEPVPGDGGVGNSWFVIELTSEHVYEAGEGGIGYSWFTVDLTSEHVDEPPPTEVPHRGGPSTAPRKRRRRARIEERFDGEFRVVKSVTERFSGRVVITTPQRFAGVYSVVNTTTQNFSASYTLSSLRFRRREEEELVLLMSDE